MKRALGVFVGSVFLAACGCTAIGCLSAVQISLESLVQWAGTDSFNVELCVGDYCDSQSIDPERAQQLRTNNQGQVSFDMIPNEVDRDRVSITITAAGKTFKAESSSIEFATDRPNGALCDPVCYYAFVDVEQGELVSR